MEPLRRIVQGELSRILDGVEEVMIKEVPPDIDGDFSFPCFAHAKKSNRKPDELALETACKLANAGGFILKAEANKGFVNITLDAGKIARVITKEIAELKESYGSGISKKSRIILEHTSANPNAPLHVGHLRNSVIGDTMARIFRFYGYTVEAQFFVNDMGGQLAILASFLSGKDYESALKDSGKKPDAWLGDMYVMANKEIDPEVAKALQKNYERGGKEIRKIFDFMVDTASSGVTETLKDYNIKMDSFVRESDFVFGGAVGDVLDGLKKTRFWFEKEGVSAVSLEKYGIEKELVLLRSDGTTLYTTRDLAYHLWKLKKADCINVIANEQTLQQQQLRAALDMLGVADVEKRVRHLSYELVTVPGMRMSSRTGEFISADDLLAEGISRAAKEINSRQIDATTTEREEIARAVALGAIRFNMVRVTPLKPIEFKWEDALNFDGESAPYLQYSHARACRILEKAGKPTECPESGLGPEESRLVMLIARFPDVVSAAAESLKPNLLPNYLIDLSEAFNRFYLNCPVVGSEEPSRSLRILLVSSFKQVMANGLSLLGIEALERM